MSSPTISNPRFQPVLESLAQQRNLLLERLKQGDKSVLPAKLQLDDAIATLQFCERHRITASAKVLELPRPAPVPLLRLLDHGRPRVRRPQRLDGAEHLGASSTSAPWQSAA